MERPAQSSSNSELAAQVARLWLHRDHESNALKGVFCALGVHRWKSLDLQDLCPGRKVEHYFWCSKVRIDGEIHSTQRGTPRCQLNNFSHCAEALV